jgi:hypothetical protein
MTDRWRWHGVNAVADRPPEGEPVPYLRALAVRLRAGGWREELVLPAGSRPYVRVINPVLVVLNDEITAAPTAPGLWWFWWSWGDRIACAENIDFTVARIAAVLGGNGH